MSPRTGRPKTDNPRTNINRVRLSDDEQERLKEVAADAELEPSVWLREAALAAIEKALRAKRRRST